MFSQSNTAQLFQERWYDKGSTLCLQSQGQLKLTPAGFFWKKTGGGAGKTVELPLKGEL